MTPHSLSDSIAPFAPVDEGLIDALADVTRLQEIVDLGLLSKDVSGILDDITVRAAAELNVPISLVTVVLNEAQIFAAAHGLAGWTSEAGGTPVEWSFCANSVRSRLPFVVEDASSHPAVRDNPLVTQDGLRCYAGIPLITSRGHVIGNLCVLGSEVRTFTDADMATLRRLASEAMARIERRRA